MSRIVDRYPRCCKRASRIVLEAAAKFVQDRMDIVLGKGKAISCTYSGRNLECPRDECPYYDE